MTAPKALLLATCLVPATFKTDTWQHLAMTIGKHDIGIYINGRKQ